MRFLDVSMTSFINHNSEGTYLRKGCILLPLFQYFGVFYGSSGRIIWLRHNFLAWIADQGWNCCAQEILDAFCRGGRFVVPQSLLTFSCFGEGFWEAFADAMSILLLLLAFLCAHCFQQLNKGKILIIFGGSCMIFLLSKSWILSPFPAASWCQSGFFPGFLSGIQDLLNNCLKNW